jgi:hypothetical protein
LSHFTAPNISFATRNEHFVNTAHQYLPCPSARSSLATNMVLVFCCYNGRMKDAANHNTYRCVVVPSHTDRAAVRREQRGIEQGSLDQPITPSTSQAAREYGGKTSTVLSSILERDLRRRKSARCGSPTIYP